MGYIEAEEREGKGKKGVRKEKDRTKPSPPQKKNKFLISAWSLTQLTWVSGHITR